jgi:RNA polymerase sigma factor (sigma-70 family)
MDSNEAMGHMGLVHMVAERYRHHCGAAITYADLVQEGAIGLCRAAEMYDRNKARCFSTYAVGWIRAMIWRALRRRWQVTVPEYRYVRWRVARGEFTTFPSQSTMLSLDGAPPGDHGVRDSGAAIAEAAEAVGAATPEDLVCRARLRAAVRRAIARMDPPLTGRERLILDQRILASDPRTLGDIGAELGISRERVRQIQRGIMRRVRTALMEHRAEWKVAI